MIKLNSIGMKYELCKVFQHAKGQTCTSLHQHVLTYDFSFHSSAYDYETSFYNENRILHGPVVSPELFVYV